jgi:hypothetical protein
MKKKIVIVFLLFILMEMEISSVVSVQAKEVTGKIVISNEEVENTTAVNSITGFAELNENDTYIYLIDKTIPEESAVTEVMPKSIKAYIDNKDILVDIPVTWKDNNNDYNDCTKRKVVFQPYWDESVYTR